MDQKRIGCFLKELRKSKGFTQEQLAEQFNVSGRTISRWENGNNMPDLSILVELADFYDVDIREIIDGERKSEIMNNEEKEKLLSVADYAEQEKNILLKRLRNISIVGLCAMVTGIAMLMIRENHVLPVTEYIMGASFGLAFGAILTALFYSTGLLKSIRDNKEKAKYMKILGIACVIICAVLLLASVIASF